MIKKNLTIFLDLDGVLVNFIGAVEDLLGVDLKDLDSRSMGKYLGISDQEIWEEINNDGSRFWSQAELYPWAQETLDICYNTTPDLFLATSPSNHPSCVKGKHELILNKMPKELHRRFFLGPHKERFAKDHNTILIDDSDKNCKAFRDAGGTAIVFPQLWNSAADHVSNRMDYLRHQLSPGKPDIHIFILEDDERRMDLFKARFKESEIANFTFDHANNVHAAKKLLKANNYDMLFLDHDLGGQTYVSSTEENTGAGLARWIKENKETISLSGAILIHSFNPQGAEYMRKELHSVHDNVFKVPSLWSKHTFGAVIT